MVSENLLAATACTGQLPRHGPCYEAGAGDWGVQGALTSTLGPVLQAGGSSLVSSLAKSLDQVLQVLFPAKVSNLAIPFCLVEHCLKLTFVQVGILHLFVQHTSCALGMNENWDEEVRADMSDAMDRLVPQDRKGELYRHAAEGPDDMPVH